MITIWLILFWIFGLGFFYYINKNYSVPKYHIRKIFHVTVPLEIALVINYISLNEFIILCIFLFCMNSLNFIKKWRDSSPIHLYGKVNFGEYVFSIGILVMGIFFWDNKFQLLIGLMIYAFPDTISAYVNYYLKKTSKTWSSTFVCFLSSFIILIFLYEFHWAVLVSLVIALVERYSPYGLDNLTIPLTFVLTAFLISSFA